MLNSVFSVKGLNLADDSVLKEICRACNARPLRPRTRSPSWNIDVVLKALTRSPFEPLKQASIRDLTKKTLFLTALATAKRVGELQAVSYAFALQGTDIILRYLPEFIAKTETDTNPIPREFRLRGLSTLVEREDEEHLLCPVRALKWYHKRTQADSRPRQLFLSVKDSSRPMSKRAISFFLRETIQQAHASCPNDLCTLLKVRAHDIRGIATSMLVWKNAPMSSILDAACWKTRSVFADFYLRDIQRQEGDVIALGPIVSAGDIVP